jgi:hypothetical protein
LLSLSQVKREGEHGDKPLVVAASRLALGWLRKMNGMIGFELLKQGLNLG